MPPSTGNPIRALRWEIQYRTSEGEKRQEMTKIRQRKKKMAKKRNRKRQFIVNLLIFCFFYVSEQGLAAHTLVCRSF